MTVESSARSHAEEFRWNAGRDDMSDGEARLQDLLSLHRAAGELAHEQRDLLDYYDTDAELLGLAPLAGSGPAERVGSPSGAAPRVVLTVELDSRAWAALDETGRAQWVDELVDAANTVGRVSEIRHVEREEEELPMKGRSDLDVPETRPWIWRDPRCVALLAGLALTWAMVVASIIAILDEAVYAWVERWGVPVMALAAALIIYGTGLVPQLLARRWSTARPASRESQTATASEETSS